MKEKKDEKKEEKERRKGKEVEELREIEMKPQTDTIRVYFVVFLSLSILCFTFTTRPTSHTPFQSSEVISFSSL